MSETTRTPSIDAEAATAIMRYAEQPIEPERAEGLAARLSRFREAVRGLDRLVGREVEPIGLHVPPEG